MADGGHVVWSGKPQTRRERDRGLSRKGRHQEPEVTSSNMANGGHVLWGGKPRPLGKKRSQVQIRKPHWN